jgi:predicted lipoprotein with Yx(FWY)xxD motif
MTRRRAPLLTIAVMALAAVGLVACGGSNSDNNASAATSAGGGQTVSTKSVSGAGTVLVNSSGQALYTNDQDSGMKIACTGSCTAIWAPLMAPSSGQPTSSDQAVMAKLSVVKANGNSQVTFGGKPLYTFTQEGPGQVTGNGFHDSFGGTDFVWTVATVSGKAAPSSTTTTGSSSGGYSGGGGYGGY